MSEIQRIVQLAELLQMQKAEQERLESELQAVKLRVRQIECEDLPDLMTEIGLREFKLADGTMISVDEDVEASISEARREEATGWLVENGFGGLVKVEVGISFGRGEQQTAAEVAAKLSEEFDGVMMKSAVHPATLKAFVKEQMRNGVAIPLDLFGVRPFNKAKLTTPKRKAK